VLTLKIAETTILDAFDSDGIFEKLAEMSWSAVELAMSISSRLACAGIYNKCCWAGHIIPDWNKILGFASAR
jgi:hypothetical protein